MFLVPCFPASLEAGKQRTNMCFATHQAHKGFHSFCQVLLMPCFPASREAGKQDLTGITKHFAGLYQTETVFLCIKQFQSLLRLAKDKRLASTRKTTKFVLASLPKAMGKHS